MTPTFENLTNKLGLVPMRIEDDNFAPYALGQIAGFPPDEAARLFTRGSAVPVGDNGQILEITVEDEGGEAAPVQTNPVQIPDDILEQHHLQRIRLAKEIEGTDRPMTAGEADEIIVAEIERRSKAHGNQV